MGARKETSSSLLLMMKEKERKGKLFQHGKSSIPSLNYQRQINSPSLRQTQQRFSQSTQQDSILYYYAPMLTIIVYRLLLFLASSPLHVQQ